MKTEKEIRAYRDNLRACDRLKCTCRSSTHADHCRTGAAMMKAVIDTLTWLLEEDAGAMDTITEEIARRARAGR